METLYLAVVKIYPKGGSYIILGGGGEGDMYRLHHEVQVSMQFTHRVPEARGCVNRIETEPSDINDLYHGTQRRVNKYLQGGQYVIY